MSFEETLILEPEFIVHIKRIRFKRKNFKGCKFISIQNSVFSYFDTNDRDFMLPKLYAALKFLTGSGDSYYDDYKGSYSFMFELNVQKNNMASQYIYHIYHYRSYIQFSVYQVVPKTDPREEGVFYKPNDEFFSNHDICYFSTFFGNYALGYMKGAQYTPKPFLKFSDSNLLCFGYSGSEYFLTESEDSEEYEKQKTLFKENNAF